MAKILIVDDDPQLRQSFEKILTADGHTVLTANTGEAGIELVKSTPPDLVIMDVRMPGMTGLEAFERMHCLDPKLPAIIMTAYGTTDTAIEATKMGAFDYILKPFDIPDVLTLIDKALQAGRFMRSRVQMNATPKEAAQDALIGKSAAMQEVYKSIGRAAPTDATVLIRGESGTGKELVARALYHHSLRAEKPFLVINCVAIPETLLESELFGYEKGAFTGAVSRRVGKIEQANHGTIFLDEIGDMPYNIQAKILRLLQERSIERLGGRQPIPVDVRIIAATNRDLEKAVENGDFREDLYYRLNVVTLNLPPLRERGEDVDLLADYFIKKFSKEMQISECGITDAALRMLQSRPWPGNVRELANTLQKAMIFSQGGQLDEDDLIRTMDTPRDAEQSRFPVQMDDFENMLLTWVRNRITHASEDNLFDIMMDYFGTAVLREALNITEGNRTRAAKLLGLSRPTLLARIEKYGLKFHTGVSGPDDPR